MTHPVSLKFDITIQSFTTWKSFVMTFIKFNKPTTHTGDDHELI